MGCIIVSKLTNDSFNTNYTEKNETESYQSDQPIYPSSSSIHDRLSTKKRVMDDEVETRMDYRGMNRQFNKMTN